MTIAEIVERVTEFFVPGWHGENEYFSTLQKAMEAGSGYKDEIYVPLSQIIDDGELSIRSQPGTPPDTFTAKNGQLTFEFGDGRRTDVFKVPAGG